LSHDGDFGACHANGMTGKSAVAQPGGTLNQALGKRSPQDSLVRCALAARRFIGPTLMREKRIFGSIYDRRSML